LKWQDAPNGRRARSVRIGSPADHAIDIPVDENGRNCGELAPPLGCLLRRIASRIMELTIGTI
jgi:hypothetical protein